MSKNIVYITTSLDGFISRKNGDIDWLVEDKSYDYYPKFIEKIDIIIMGESSYEKVLSFGIDWPYPNQTSYVFTNKDYEDKDNIKFVKGDISSFIEKINSKKDIWIMGGANIIMQFFEKNIIDEIILSFQPIILGDGIPLFSTQTEKKLKLLEVTSYDKGSVQMHYKIIQ